VRQLLIAALGALTLLVPLPATAQTSLTAYDAVREALVAVWDELPLSVRNATLVDSTPAGFGQFDRRAGKSFKPDEAVTVYAELYGYGVTPRADGGYVRELSADLALAPRRCSSLPERARASPSSDRSSPVRGFRSPAKPGAIAVA